MKVKLKIRMSARLAHGVISFLSAIIAVTTAYGVPSGVQREIEAALTERILPPGTEHSAYDAILKELIAADKAADKVPEADGSYPDSFMFGKIPLPAYGFYVRHADNVVFDNVEVKTAIPDARPRLVVEDGTFIQK